MDETRATANPDVSPKQLALTYDRVVSAHWRGETDTAIVLDTWFEAHWSDQAPPEPDAPPEGTSVLGDSGAGIRWYARDEAVLGYVSRRPDGCYRVPVREAVPAFRASWDILELEAVRQPDADRLLRHDGPPENRGPRAGGSEMRCRPRLRINRGRESFRRRGRPITQSTPRAAISARGAPALQSRFGALGDRHADHAAPLCPGAVVVAHVGVAKELAQHEPGVA